MGCTVDFRATGDDRGCYYEETHRCLIFLNSHENLEDIYKTINHEVLHYCIEGTNISIDELQEEKLIFNIQWAEYSLS